MNTAETVTAIIVGGAIVLGAMLVGVCVMLARAIAKDVGQ